METQLQTRANVVKALRTALGHLDASVGKLDRERAAKEYRAIEGHWRELQQRHFQLMGIADDDLQSELQVGFDAAERDVRSATVKFEELQTLEASGGDDDGGSDNVQHDRRHGQDMVERVQHGSSGDGDSDHVQPDHRHGPDMVHRVPHGHRDGASGDDGSHQIRYPRGRDDSRGGGSANAKCPRTWK